MDKLLLLSAKRLAELIRSREVSSEEVIKIHINHAKKVNPFINAIVQSRMEEAIEDAKKVDKQLSEKDREEFPPLYGVPCTIKENFAFVGFPQTGGLNLRRNFYPLRNATVVDRILESGAIPIGFTNVSELCMWMESNNRVYGRTNNPYDLSRIAGGSSGGEGAIIGSGASPFGLGADIGGSIRMPAFFNGVFGHKPTGGLVPGTGQHPMAENQALRYLTTGPIARKAEDLSLLLKIYSGKDGLDKGCLDFQIDWDEKLDITNLEFISIESNGLLSVEEELIYSQRKVVDFLKKKGAKEKKIQFPKLKNSLEIWSSMLSKAGGKKFEDMMFEGRSNLLIWELIHSFYDQSEFTFPGIALSIIEKIPDVFGDHADDFAQQGEALKKELSDALGKNCIVLFPSYSRTVPKHNEPILFHSIDWIYTAIMNVLEFPVTQVPLGLSGKGLPLGIQIIGNHGRDLLTINLAYELEKEFGGWQPPIQFS